jgi:segregation and condensation protein B
MKTTHIVEAALFSAGKPLSIEEIATQTNLSPEAVKEACKELAKEYDGRDTVLEVGKAGAKWAMQVRPQAAEPATKFAPPEIPGKLLKTLALIAYHQPMKQSELVDMIGTKVYDHVPELVERGLVKAREEGVTKILVTTALFPEYFGLDAEDREQVRATMAKLVGLPPPAKKTAEAVLDEGGSNVPDEGETPTEPDAEGTPEGGEGEPEAHAASPTPTTT